MPRQFIYTSARRGLEPGKSGFCCVARDRDLPQDLQRELERLSRYERFNSEGHPLIMRFVRLDIRSGQYAVLSRISDSDTDYSQRDNHIAHHLVMSPEEVSDLPDPASILLAWNGWRRKWDEPPRILNDRDQFRRKDLEVKGIPAASEVKLQNLVDGQAVIPTVLTVEQGAEYDVILAIRSALLTLPAQKRWNNAFTNFLLTTNRPSEFIWSANWINRELPYELALKTAAEVESETDEVIRNKEVEAPHRITAASRVRALPAPVVEIPDFKKPKRPKKKWTQRRLSRWVNTGIVMLGILCAYLAFSWFRSYQQGLTEQPQPINPPTFVETPPIKPSPIESMTVSNLQQEWQELYTENRLIAHLDTARELAAKLEANGYSLPSQQLRFISSARSQPEDTALLVPNWALTVSNSGSIHLTPSVQLQLSPQEFLLLPKAFHDEVLEFKNTYPSAIRKHLSDPNSFDTATIERCINECKRDILAELISIAPDRRDAVSKYLELTEEVLPREPPQALNEIGLVLDQPPYIDIEQSEPPYQAAPLSYKEYLYEIFDSYMVVRYRAFKRTTEFSLALSDASSRNFDTPIEAAKAMRRAFQIAEPQDDQTALKLEKIQYSWDAVFHRDDLMKETLVGFSIEQLEGIRDQISSLSDRFSEHDLAAVRKSSFIESKANRLLEIAYSANLDQEWVVIPIQTTQLPQNK